MVDRMERNKDLVQELVESTATHVGRITTIITTAVADIAREIGDAITDGFEMRDAARKAKADEAQLSVIDAELEETDAEILVEEPAPEVLNLEGAFEAPVVPDDLDDAPPAEILSGDEAESATLAGMMESPDVPDPDDY
ncbi:hypothetical protein [Gordonia sp. NPDC003429]